MKKLLLFICVIMTYPLFAQTEQTELTGALGLTFGMDITTAKNIMSEKSGTLEKSTEKFLLYSKVILGDKETDLFTLLFVNNKLISIKALFNSELEAKTQQLYDELKTIIAAKYGEPKSYRNFKDPYFNGDGYEMQAVRKGKAEIVSYWLFKDNNYISIEIGEIEGKLNVTVIYQNSFINKEIKANQDLKKQEGF